MYTYHCLNPIAKVGTDKFTAEYQETKEISQADAILVRSASMKETEWQDRTLAVARAGAGVNNIPCDVCSEKGIVVFNTPGANANGVKELVIAGMLLASRDIVGGIRWVEEQAGNGNIAKDTEKAKKAFAGCELVGKKLGVIGLGAIGVLVANSGIHLGMEVYGYDPFVSIESAWKLSRDIHHTRSLEELFQECDYISIHVPANEHTKGMIDAKAIEQMKQGVVVLNFSRDVLVKEEDMLKAMEEGKVEHYVTDFPTPKMAGAKGAIVIPHLGASTEESEDNCAKMAVRQLRNYLEHGNIKNSVNYPDCDMGFRGENIRVLLLHHNVPNMIGQFTKILARDNMNIADMANKSKGGYAYTMIDIDTPVPEGLAEELRNVPEVLKVRIIGQE